MLSRERGHSMCSTYGEFLLNGNNLAISLIYRQKND